MEGCVKVCILMTLLGYGAAQSTFGSISNGHLSQGGTDHAKKSLDQCEKYCQYRSSCASFDYHWPSNTCRLQVGPDCAMTPLLLEDGWTHHELDYCSSGPGRQATICTLNRNHYFLRAGTTSRTGGFFLGVLTLSACLTACTNNMTCQHVLWDFQNGRTCHGFSSQPTVTTSPCCYVATRTCSAIDTTIMPVSNGTTTTGTTTTATTTTTTPIATTTFNTPTTPTVNYTSLVALGSSGKCPDPFGFRNGTLQAGTTLNANTTQQCLSLCFGDTTCAGVVFSFLSRQCVKLTAYNPASNTASTCCILYYKIDCNHMCYSVPSTTKATTDTSAQQITLPTTISATLTQCPGDLCRSQYTLNTANNMYTVTYGCETSNTLPDMFCSSATSGTMTTTTCVCRGFRCNAISQLLPAAYWPLDCHPRDYSGFLRDGQSLPANALAYDRNDAAKNFSASFNGSTTFEAPNTVRISFGDQSTTTGALGSITVAFWMRRTEISGTMTLISNGIKGIAPIEIRSNMVDNINHALQARFRIGTNTYTVTGNGYMFRWHFVAAVLTRTSANMITTALFVTNPTSTTTPTTVVNAMTQGPVADPAPTVKLNLSNLPIRLGSNKFPVGLSLGDVDFYKGFLDEVYIFNTALSLTQLQALVDMTRSV